MLKEGLKISLYSIKRKKFMFLLNILGVVIGIAAIVALISIGEGMQASIEEAFEDFGADKIIVMAGGLQGMAGGFGSGVSLEEADVKLIERVPGVVKASGMTFSQYPIKYRKESIVVYISGIGAEDAKDFFEDIASVEFESGRIYKKGEDKVVIIGSRVKTAFDKDLKVGDSLEIKGTKFKIVGIMKSIGSPQDDNSVTMPLDTYRDLFGKSDELTMIYASATDADRAMRVAKDIEEELDDKYGEGIFSAITSEQLADQISSIFDMITLVLAGIASISLIVAGVGIANTMMMSIMERTREIGVMKAIGATNYQVMEIFLIESALLGFFGGIFGIVLGTGMSKAISFYGQTFFFALNTAVTPQLALFALGFSVIVGMLSGAWPARRAAKMNTVDALRYE